MDIKLWHHCDVRTVVWEICIWTDLMFPLNSVCHGFQTCHGEHQQVGISSQHYPGASAAVMKSLCCTWYNCGIDHQLLHLRCRNRRLWGEPERGTSCWSSSGCSVTSAEKQPTSVLHRQQLHFHCKALVCFKCVSEFLFCEDWSVCRFLSESIQTKKTIKILKIRSDNQSTHSKYFQYLSVLSLFPK